METIDMWQLVSWTQFCFEPAIWAYRTIFDSNRKTEKNLRESSKENLVFKFYIEPKSILWLV